jgi:hypothetical protein
MTRTFIFLAFFVVVGCNERRCLEAKEVTEYISQGFGSRDDVVFPVKRFVCVKWEVEK